MKHISELLPQALNNLLGTRIVNTKDRFYYDIQRYGFYGTDGYDPETRFHKDGRVLCLYDFPKWHIYPDLATADNGLPVASGSSPSSLFTYLEFGTLES